MNEPVLTLDSTRLRAEPGGQAQVSVKVRNPGTLVESFRIDVVGLDADWWQVHPPELPVYPGKEESALVVLTPPLRAEAPEEALPFGVRAISTLDDQRSVVEEGDLEVGRVFDLQSAIVPVTSRGRWVATHRVQFTNWGNSPVQLQLVATDKDEELGFKVTPDRVLVPVGGKATARVRVRPRNPFLRGTAVHRPFQVIGEPLGGGPPPGTPRSPAARAGVPDPSRPVIDAAMQHKPILTRGLVMSVMLLVAAIAGLVLLLLRTSSVQGATQADVAPEAPTEVVAQATAADQIHLKWTPVDRATGYVVKQMDEGGTVAAVKDVPGGAAAFDAKIDKPSTTVCFTVAAVRKDLAGPESEKQCATTPDGRLPAPTGVTVTPADGGRYTVRWQGDPQNAHLVLLDKGQVGSPITPGVFEAPIDIPSGKHCVQVVAKQGETAASPLSEEACVTSAGSPGATASSGNGGGTGGGGGSGSTPTTSSGTGSGSGSGVVGWVAVINDPYQEEVQANAGLKELTDRGIQGAVIPVTKVPSLGYRQGLVVVATGFATAAEAQQFCTSPPGGLTPTTCRVAEATG